MILIVGVIGGGAVIGFLKLRKNKAKSSPVPDFDDDMTLTISLKMKPRLKMGMNEEKIRSARTLPASAERIMTAYTKWLLRQPKKEILRLAPDYLVRKAIVEAAKRYTRVRYYFTALPFCRSG